MDATTTVKRFMSDKAPKNHEAFRVRLTTISVANFSARYPHGYNWNVDRQEQPNANYADLVTLRRL
jgi:hypothetical protein